MAVRGLAMGDVDEVSPEAMGAVVGLPLTWDVSRVPAWAFAKTWVVTGFVV
jgi:hypothetical protein